MQGYNVYEYVNISNVINQLHLKKTNQIGYYIYTLCPFCQREKEKNGYLKLNTINNTYICKNCQESGSSIDLYANLKYISKKDAFKMLLKDTPVLDNVPYVFNNPIKDEWYRDLVYRKFLDMQNLNKVHYNKLKNMNFTDEYIRNYQFKSIENNNYKKRKICMELQKQELRLDGIPGFYQDTNFKWNYKSHKGIFIPVILNNKIQGLRILLDNEYRLETENIWFSSNNEYNGTKAYNWPMILTETTRNWLDIYNSKQKEVIIIATEMILAHKLFNNSNMTVIGIPNNIDKDLILNIVKRMNASEVILYLDKYTILHTSNYVFSNVIDVLEKQNIRVDFRVAVSEKNIEMDTIEMEKQRKTA